MYVKTKSHNEDEKRVMHACNVVYKCIVTGARKKTGTRHGNIQKFCKNPLNL